ncbi:MAG: VOC family protein [Pseudomonadota bacterium]
MLEQICPILPSRDFDACEAFYHALGFQTWYRDDGYLLMNRDRVEVHFFLNRKHRPEACDHGAYIRPADVDAFTVETAKLGLSAEPGFPRFLPAEDKPWGMREATLWDPDGNLLRIGQEIRPDG